MNEYFVPYELAKKLEEKGFPQHWSDDDYITENEECECHFEVGTHYNRWFIPEHLPTIAAPTISQVLKWFREEKEVYVSVIPEYNEFNPVKGVTYRLEVAYWKDDEFGYETVEWLDKETHTIITFDSYEKALLEEIEYVIDNLI